MHDDYLWDETGDLDAEAMQMVALQRTLAPLRYEPEPLRLPHATTRSQRPSQRSSWVLPALAAAAAALLVLGLRSTAEPDEEASVIAVSAQRPDPGISAEVRAEQDERLAQVSGAAESEGAGSENPGSGFPSADPSSKAPPSESSATSTQRTTGPKRARKSRRRGSGAETRRGESEELSVDCILDPTGCAARKSAKPTPRSGETTPTVDCILDPSLCPAEGTKKASPRSDDDAPRVDCVLDPSKCEPLPATLSSADIRKGIRPVKSSVAACGPKHSAPGGQRVKVKLAIAGATGRVLDTHAMGTAADTPLGRCIEKAVSKARFPRFKRARLAAVYPFTMPGSKPEPGPKTPTSAENLMQEVSGRVNVKARGCALLHDIPSGTRVDLEVKVSAAGKVTKVLLLPRDPLSSDATRCLSTAIKKLVVSPSTAGVNGRIPLSL